jgi:hypothetical protein
MKSQSSDYFYTYKDAKGRPIGRNTSVSQLSMISKTNASIEGDADE